jgi:hypothetical protein
MTAMMMNANMEAGRAMLLLKVYQVMKLTQQYNGER